MSGPSASVSANVSGAFSFGNVSVGLKPELNLGLGLDIGIPFLGGGSSGDSNGNNDSSGTPQSFSERMQDKYPNKSFYLQK